MPSRESMKFSFYLKHKDWNKIKFLIKMFFKDRYHRKTIILDNITVPFWKKIPHTHKIMEFEDEGYCFCTKCHRSWNIEDWKIEKRDQQLKKILGND